MIFIKDIEQDEFGMHVNTGRTITISQAATAMVPAAELSQNRRHC